MLFARPCLIDRHPSQQDETIANLDEALIRDVLNHFLVGHMAIIIAHRLSTIRYVDHIFVLKSMCIECISLTFNYGFYRFHKWANPPLI